MPEPRAPLVVQTPGQLPGTEPSELAPLLDLPVLDLAQGLAALTDAELNVLVDLEHARDSKEPRAAYRDLLGGEQMRRLEDSNPTSDPVVDAAAAAVVTIGDALDYAHLAARDVDPNKIDRPVLTLDGWQLPTPRAQGG